MQKLKILHLDSNHQILAETLAANGFENDYDYESPKEKILQKINDYDGIIIRSRFSIDKSFIEKSKNLKFIARVGAGLENIDVALAQENNIKLIAAPEGNRNAVAEHTLALLLALFNKICPANKDVKSGNWQRELHRGVELDGKTVGIIGYGNMGKTFAKKLRGFDVHVIFHDILPNLGDENATQVSLAELQNRSDIISLHIPLTTENTKMIGDAFIERCIKNFWLLNTARGKHIVISDLVKNLKSRKILGAGLDVLEYERSSFENLFENETNKDFNYLAKSENVILTPHVAGWTVESNIKLAEVIAKKIIEMYKN